MSTVKVNAYAVECDSCGADGVWDNDLNPFYDADLAVDWMKDEYGWIEHEGKHYCRGCTAWNESGTELIPKP